MDERAPDTTLRLGLAAHISAWTIVGMAAFLQAGVAWFPAAPAMRAVVIALGVAGVALAWHRATARIWLLGVHSLSLAALAWAGFELGLDASLEEEPSRYPYAYRMHGFEPGRRAEDNIHRASTNDAGLREPAPVPLAKPEGTFRILVLGGSAMFGIGAADGSSVPAHLERMLNSWQPPPHLGIERFEVINAGQGWYNSTQELVFFVTELWRYEPDVVFVVDGYNDLHHSVVWGVPPPLNEVGFQSVNWMRRQPGLWEEPTWGQSIRVGLRASEIRRRLGVPVERLFAPTVRGSGRPEQRLENPREAEPSVFRQLLANWVALDAMADRLGFRAHFALQPVIYSKRHHADPELAFLEQAKDYAPRVGAAWERLEAFMAVEAPRHGIEVFQSDVHLRDARQALFNDYCHLGAEGYALVARTLADEVARDLRTWPWETTWVAAAQSG